jgi:tetratricopeptide (TPR) repeat protein
MTRQLSHTFIAAGVAIVVGFAGSCRGVNAAETNTVSEAGPPPATDKALDPLEIQRSYLELQVQLQSALLAIQQMREEAQSAAKNNQEAVAGRLRAIEQSIDLGRERELQAVQQSNRFVLLVSGSFALVGLGAMLFTAWLHLRAMSRIAEVAAVLPAAHGLVPAHSFAALGAGEHPGGPHAVEPSSARLLGALERLERRVHELEHTSAAPLTVAPARPNGEHVPGSGAPALTAASPASSAPEAEERNSRLTLLLGKGQALLNLGKTDEALACFDEALRLDPNNGETLVKRGAAFEKAKRFDEAIECYDRAIALNSGLTLAYLYKGGVYNQLERFDEALQCYEQALRTRQKAAAAA